MKHCCAALLLMMTTLATAQNGNKPAYWLGKSVGKLPMLAYGLGDDRLGGAKMGYIDTGILLKVVDSAHDLYKVQLSQYHSAYLEKQYISKDTALKQKPFYLLNSWSTRGNDAEMVDLLALSMDEKLPYKSWMEIAPAKIMLDVYGVQSNSNWITQFRSLKEVKNVYFNQVEDDVVRITIELVHQQHWGYSIGYRGKSLQVRVHRQPNPKHISDLVIAIDAGHGGTNTGAKGINTGIIEKEYTLLFAKAFEKQLKRKGVSTIMVRNNDTSINNVDRVLWLQEQKPHILISFHLNSSGKPEVKGVSTYYKHIGFRPLSTAVLNRMLELELNEFANVGNFNFMLNAPTDFPNTLVEVAFLSNPEDEQRIRDPKFHKAVADKVYRGIKDWLKQLK